MCSRRSDPFPRGVPISCARRLLQKLDDINDISLHRLSSRRSNRSPRDDVVFRLWQCDKENHGWCEGPPLTVPCQSFDLLAGPSPFRQNQLRTKKEYSFAPLAARSSIRTLAGLKRLYVSMDP
jgi:hypothetical protein